jgi:hypothetical protein
MLMIKPFPSLEAKYQAFQQHTYVHILHTTLAIIAHTACTCMTTLLDCDLIYD